MWGLEEARTLMSQRFLEGEVQQKKVTMHGTPEASKVQH